MEVADTSEERKKKKVFVGVNMMLEIPILWDKYSSLTKMIRVTAYCMRFIQRLRGKRFEESPLLTAGELDEALMLHVKHSQQHEFEKEFAACRDKMALSKKSKLKDLHPFIDAHGLLRVGGRLHKARMPFDSKHQMILPANGQLTQLILKDIHEKNFHAGTQLMVNTLRQRFWILRARNCIRHFIHGCVRCVRSRGQTCQQMMGTLPSSRVNVGSPFEKAAVDYAGPIMMRESRRRGPPRKNKGYIAVFVCMNTRAIHLEVVSDLTSEAFIAAFRRFVARRGRVRDMYSDNGTNFVGANNQMKTILSEMGQKEFCGAVGDAVASMGTDWHFNPPGAPHFGGLWEAGVKSMKQHLYKTLGNSLLTFEEMSTALIQIEACLNSRPLYRLTDDTNDMNVLTPGHFLIGRPLNSVPDRITPETKISCLKRWDIIQKQVQVFWKRWKEEYLHQLQQRRKWFYPKDDVKIDDVVLIKDENTPSTYWSMGRVIEVHPGSDGLVRVATLKTQGGTLKRPIAKLCPLQQEEKQETEEEKEEEKHEEITKKKKSTKVVAGRDSHGVKALITIVLLGMIAMACGVDPSSQCPQANITRLNSGPMMFFENIGNLHLSNHDWTIIVYYDLSEYRKALWQIKMTRNRLREFCTKMTQIGYCDGVLGQLDLSIEDVEIESSLIQQGRSKRFAVALGAAAVGGVVSAMYHHFMESDSTNYEEMIEEYRLNDNHLLDLIKNQTSIVEATNNVIKQDHQRVFEQFRTIVSDLVTLEKATNSVQRDLSVNDAKHELNGLIIRLVMMLQRYKQTEDRIMEAISQTSDGGFHALLLNLQQLRQQLKHIAENIPSTLQLPEYGNLYEVSKMMKVRAMVTSKRIIFELKIPLIRKNKIFQLWRVTPIPTVQENKFVWIQPSTEYLAMSVDRDQYYPMTSDELKACFTSNMTWMCEVGKPIFNRASNVSKCEVNLLLRRGNLDQSCTMMSKNASQWWVQLGPTNRWIFVVPFLTTMDLTCGASLSNINITGTGILKIADGCKMHHNTFTITAHTTFTSVTSSAYRSTQDQTVPTRFNDRKEVGLQSKTLDGIHFDQAMKHIDSLLNEQKHDDFNFHHIHHYAATYGLWTVAIVCLFIYYLLTRAKKESMSGPIFTITAPAVSTAHSRAGQNVEYAHSTA